jgi:5-methylcytosine-specific restriction endonuclease McrA
MLFTQFELEKQEQALELKRKDPGISMRQFAKLLKLKPQGLVRLLQPIGEWEPQLEDSFKEQPLQHYPSKKSVRFFQKLTKERNYKNCQCESCSITVWNGIPFVNIAEKDHIDGNKKNNDINNLRMLCPNCHSHTTTRFSIGNISEEQNQTTLSTKNLTTKNLIVSESDILHNDTMRKKYRAIHQQSRKSPKNVVPLESILEGKVPTFRTPKLVVRMFNAGLRKLEYEWCLITHWRGIPIGMFLQGHHKDGQPWNHKNDNLEILCPNCHACCHTFSRTTNENFTGQQQSYLSSNAYRYNSETEFVQNIKTLLLSENRAQSMRGCAKELNISIKKLKTITLREFPELWQPDPGSSRRLDLNDPIVKEEVLKLKHFFKF